MPRLRITFLILTVLFLNLVLSTARAADANWDPVSDQEKQLKDNPLDTGAGALVIFKRGEIQVQQPNASLWTTRIQTYTRIKILKDSGREFGNVVIDSPKFVRLSKIEGRTILPSGEIVPLDTSKVFHGVAFQSGKNFTELTTSFAFSSVEPGAIIEYQTEEYADWFYSMPWIFDTRGIATLQSTLRTVISSNMQMAQLSMGTTLNKISADQKQTSAGTVTDFGVQYLLPVREEPFAPPFRDRAVMVLLTPARVVFAGQEFPIITSWDDVGRQASEGIATMNKTNKEVIAKAKELAAKDSDPRARAEAIYKYLQENVTSSGLAGFSLNETADEVITSKHGDPDDINAVFVTMLKEIKVDADLVLVATRNWQTLAKEIPSESELSRAIVRINFKDGPVYADAADTGAPFGELPWFEKGITGMVVKGSKAQMTEIPMGAPDDNISTSKFDLKLDSNWKVDGDVETIMKGDAAIDFRGDMIGITSNKVEQTLTQYLGLGYGDTEVSKITHPDFQDTSQPLDLKTHVQYTIAEEKGPGEVLLNPWMGDATRSPSFKATQRQSYVEFETPEKRVTTSSWTLPLDIRVEKLPAEISMQGDMADFSHSCTQTGATVTCTRTLTIKKVKMPNATDYPNIKKFFDEVAQHDQEVILLQK